VPSRPLLIVALNPFKGHDIPGLAVEGNRVAGNLALGNMDFRDFAAAIEYERSLPRRRS
jgi:hypothetical protein